MKKFNQIGLNEYDQQALYDVLVDVLEKEYEDFQAKAKTNGLEFETHSEREDAEFLRWNCSSELKEHVYYKAVILMGELTEAMDE